MRAIAKGLCVLAAGCAVLCATPCARGFLGFADTSFVTVIANPAEAANWAAELQRMSAQLSAATGTLENVGALRAYAGDPKAAVGALPDLAGLSVGVAALAQGARTSSDLAGIVSSLSTAGARAGALLERSGAGGEMSVFGRSVPRDTALYGSLAAGSGASGVIHAQISSEQAARAAIASELSAAWLRFRAATTESEKQALLSEVSQLQAQNQVLDSRRRALMDDESLSEREDRALSAVRSRAADEERLAESALLNANASSRAQASEGVRLATLSKVAARPIPADYSGLRLWTTADTGGVPP